MHTFKTEVQARKDALKTLTSYAKEGENFQLCTLPDNKGVSWEIIVEGEEVGVSPDSERGKELIANAQANAKAAKDAEAAAKKAEREKKAEEKKAAKAAKEADDGAERLNGEKLPKAGSKMRNAMDMFRTPGGATGKEVTEKVGNLGGWGAWLRKAATRYGLDLHESRDGREMRYWLTEKGAPSPVPAQPAEPAPAPEAPKAEGKKKGKAGKAKAETTPPSTDVDADAVL